MVKNRSAMLLYVRDSPYKPRTVRNKKAYSRKIKHQISR